MFNYLDVGRGSRPEGQHSVCFSVVLYSSIPSVVTGGVRRDAVWSGERVGEGVFVLINVQMYFAQAFLFCLFV